jgi:peptide/nickel transport system substrate-binding protein
LTNPWNPTNGSNWAYDMSVIRATQAYGTFSDPWTGLAVPQRIESAEVTAQADLPIGQSSASASWLTFSQADTIEVPADAWIDWNAETETFITVGEAFTETLTASIKSVVTYPADLWDVTWHDGTPVSIADFIMPYILTFDRAAEGVSDVFDPAAATALRNFKATFKGMRIVSEDPLVLEYYTDNWQPDAENNVVSFWPNYAYGTGSWFSMAVGLRVEAAGEAAFSQAKAGTIEKEWMSYLSGPTIELLKAQLDAAVAENYIPYAATLGKWVTADVATATWANYAEWFRQRGHFWVGTGPYYVERAFPVEGMVVLKHYADFPDMADRWSGYGVPKVAVVDVTAPASVTVGQEAEFEVDITFAGEAYPADGIDAVNWLLFAADGSVAAQGAAEAAGEGFYTVTVSADDAAKLTAGSSKLLVVVVSNIVSIPAFGSVEFPVTAP